MPVKFKILKSASQKIYLYSNTLPPISIVGYGFDDRFT